MPNIYRQQQRQSEPTHIGEVMARTFPAIERLTRLYNWAQENITECLDDCDENGKVKVSYENGEEWVVPCPIYNENCKRGQILLEKAKVETLNMLHDIIPVKIKRDMLNPRFTQSLLQAQTWDFNGFLYISGDVGTGKSFCAAWCLYKRRSCKAKWFSAYRAVMSGNLDSACYAPVLVIDDLGKENATAQTKATIGEIISQRYDRELPTIITSNIDPSELDERYGKWVSDRIACSGKVVRCNSASIRIA